MCFRSATGATQPNGHGDVRLNNDDLQGNVHIDNSRSTSNTAGNRGDGVPFSGFEDDQGPLPTGWERRRDDLSQEYCFNHSSGSTSWYRPSA
jgi:hypothetical protein